MKAMKGGQMGGVGWDVGGLGWDGMGWDGMGWVYRRTPPSFMVATASSKAGIT